MSGKELHAYVAIGEENFEPTERSRRRAVSKSASCFLRRITRRRGPTAPDAQVHHVEGSCAIQPLESERGFRLSGDLDLYSVTAVREALESELHERLVLDLTAVDFMDDSGLGLLVAVFKRLRDQGGSLAIRNPTSQVLRALEITGVAQLPELDDRARGRKLSVREPGDSWARDARSRSFSCATRIG